jgi:aminoglycoside 6'-N-acetyltransferase
MIGEISHVGHGVGPRALGLLLARMGRDPSVSLVGLATSVDNVSAVRAYEKAGFSRMRQFDDPEFGPCWFMIADLRGTGRPTTR